LPLTARTRGTIGACAIALIGALTGALIGPVISLAPLGAATASAQIALTSASFVQVWASLPLGQDSGNPIAESSPTVANLDAAGPAVVVGDRAGYLYTYHLTDGSPVSGWPFFDGGAPIDSTPSVAPLNGNPLSSVFVGLGDAQHPVVGGYMAIGPNGQQLWRIPVTDPPGDKNPVSGVQASLTVASLQGSTDVFAGSLDQESYALNASTGSALAGWPFFSADSVFSTAAVGDLYGTGQEELVMGGASSAGLAMGQTYTAGGQLRVINALGQMMYDYTSTQEIDSSPAIGDFLAGGAIGIVVGTGSYYAGSSDTNTIKAFTNRLAPVWSETLDGHTTSSPALADVEGSGQLDVVEGTDTGAGGSVWVLNGTTGATVWHEPVIGRVIGSVVAADLTGGEYQDLLVPTIHGVEILDGRSGAQVAVLGANLGFQNSPLVTDDPNGTIGITLAGYNGHNQGMVVHYEIPGSNGALAVGGGSWPMFHHDPQLTGASAPLPNLGRVTPSALSAQAASGQVSLSWSAPSGAGGAPATGYNVYVGTAPGRESSSSVNGSTLVTSTHYAVTGLASGARYYFEVTAVNPAGEGAPSNEVSASLSSPPAAPSGLTATAGNAQVSLAWAPPAANGRASVSGYNVYVSTTPGSQGTNVASVKTTSYTATGLQNGTTYYFEVTAFNAAGESPASAQVAATPVPPAPPPPAASAPPAPTGLSATPGDGVVSLAWTGPTANNGPTASNGAKVNGYDVYISTTAGSQGTQVASTGTTTYTASGLQNGTTYYFEVTAFNSVGQGSASAQVAAAPAALTGYRLVAANGRVFALGKLPSYPAPHTSSAVVGVASTPDGQGYWLVMANGTVVGAGDAHLFGSIAGKHLNSAIAGLAATPDGRGYWLVAADGGIFDFGDAQYYGSLGGRRLNRPIVGIAGTSDGRGYWLLAADGGIFAFGDARFYGSPGAKHLNQPIVGITATSDGRGYWLVAADGGVFGYGDARFYGSMGSRRLNRPIVGIASTADGHGYWMVAADGGVFGFGDAQFFGSLGGKALHQKFVAIAS
jgi:fibronectin type 3 domain-containing protein